MSVIVKKIDGLKVMRKGKAEGAFTKEIAAQQQEQAGDDARAGLGS